MNKHSVCPAILMAATALFVSGATAEEPTAEQVKEIAEQRALRYADELEAYLRTWLVDEYPQRAARAWNRNYSSINAYLASIEPNRERWRRCLNPPAFKITGPLQQHPHAQLTDINAQWLSLPLGPVTAEAVWAVPASAETRPVPLVIVPHGLNGFPEAVFGLDQNHIYHAYARKLVEAGFAVLAPVNVCSPQSRNQLERMCRLADTTLSGIEMVRLQCLLDVLLKDPRIDADRVGIWGLSLGGRATMYWTPLEPRIKVAVISAWFNRRPEKMVVPSKDYSCFLDVDEGHVFLRGWLTEFSDPDVISMICPRPVLIQTGKQDPISHWPDVVEDFQQARTHYEKLGSGQLIEMDLHDGGHEARIASGLRFLRQHLTPSK